MNKRCANRLSSSEIENRANASKISNVIETRSRNRRDLVSEGKIGIKNKTEIASWGWRKYRDTMLVSAFMQCITRSLAYQSPDQGSVLVPSGATSFLTCLRIRKRQKGGHKGIPCLTTRQYAWRTYTVAFISGNWRFVITARWCASAVWLHGSGVLTISLYSFLPIATAVYGFRWVDFFYWPTRSRCITVRPIVSVRNWARRLRPKPVDTPTVVRIVNHILQRHGTNHRIVISMGL